MRESWRGRRDVAHSHRSTRRVTLQWRQWCPWTSLEAVARAAPQVLGGSGVCAPMPGGSVWASLAVDTRCCSTNSGNDGTALLQKNDFPRHYPNINSGCHKLQLPPKIRGDFRCSHFINGGGYNSPPRKMYFWRWLMIS